MLGTRKQKLCSENQEHQNRKNAFREQRDTREILFGTREYGPSGRPSVKKARPSIKRTDSCHVPFKRTKNTVFEYLGLVYYHFQILISRVAAVVKPTSVPLP